MTPLKITFHLATPMVVDSESPLHLDALIASTVAREAESLGDPNAWARADDLSSYLDRASFPAGWVWRASALQFVPAQKTNFLYDHINTVRRSDPDDIYGAHMRGDWAQERAIKPETWKVNTVSGQLRGYQMLIRTRMVDRAVAWAVGDKDAIEHACSQIKALGKIRRNGHGRVYATSVEEAPEGEANHWMLRTLPDGVAGLAGVNYQPVIATLRAPYWRKANRVVAQDPLLWPQDVACAS